MVKLSIILTFILTFSISIADENFNKKHEFVNACTLAFNTSAKLKEINLKEPASNLCTKMYLKIETNGKAKKIPAKQAYNIGCLTAVQTIASINKTQLKKSDQNKLKIKYCGYKQDGTYPDGSPILIREI